MAALVYSFPTKTERFCDNPVCREQAVFTVHNKDRSSYSVCLDHIAQYQKPGCRLTKLGESDDVETGDRT